MSSKSVDRGGSGRSVPAPSREIALLGEEREPASLQWLGTGRLRFAYHNGAIRYLLLDGHEVLRGVAFIIRDYNWGTYVPEMDAPRIQETADGLRIGISGRCREAECNLDLEGSIEVSDDRELAFRVTATMREDFRTNRIGFAVLHPAFLSGEPVSVEHVDGGVEESRFPERIEPWQPFFEVRSLTHEVEPGVRATCRMTGETFEMEDQRQWSDASFKTYCRPLSKPFPFVVEAGDAVTQAVTLTLDGTPSAKTGATATTGDDAPVDADVQPGVAAGHLPELGLGAYPGRLDADPGARERLAALGADHLMLEVKPPLRDLADVLGRFAGLLEQCGCRAVLDVVFGDEAAAPGDLRAVAQAARDAGVDPDVVLVHPPGPPVLAAAREAFPRAPVGGGHNAFFTELNRNRPPEGIDIGRWTTNPTVHARDDLSVMETVEVLPPIVDTARSFCHGASLWAGPNTMRMRFNPNATEKETGPRRLADGTPETVDARQRALFGSAWVLASTAQWARAGLDHLTWFEPYGPLGVMYRREDYPQAWYDDTDAARVYPVYHVLHGLLRGGEAELVATTSSRPERVVPLAQRSGDATVLWLANLAATPQTVRLQGVPEEASVAVLDAARFVAAVTEPEGFWEREAGRLGGSELVLDAYAVARLVF